MSPVKVLYGKIESGNRSRKEIVGDEDGRTKRQAAPRGSLSQQEGQTRPAKTVRARIAETKGPEFWRSLEELAGSTEFKEIDAPGISQRCVGVAGRCLAARIPEVDGASMALAGMTACTKQPLEAIVPYVKQPEELVPGRPLFFATAFSLGGYASPVLVESHTYRPTKVEGNEQHPASLGGTDIFAQASILGMYDPDRSQNVIHNGELGHLGSVRRSD